MNDINPLPFADILDLPQESAVVFSITNEDGTASHYALLSTISLGEDSLIKVEIVRFSLSFILYQSWETEPGHFVDDCSTLYQIYRDSPVPVVAQTDEQELQLQPYLEVAYSHD